MPVYFLQAGQNGPVKIGRSDDPKSRLMAIRADHYETLNLIRIIPGHSRSERWLHVHFMRLRLRGEWFTYDPEMLTINPPEFETFEESWVPHLLPVMSPLYSWIKKKRMSKSDAAKFFGMSESYIVILCQGKAIFRESTAARIHVATDGMVSANDFLIEAEE